MMNDLISWLTIIVLGVDKFRIFFLIFARNLGDSLHEIAKAYFQGRIRKNILYLLSAKFAKRVVKIK